MNSLIKYQPLRDKDFLLATQLVPIHAGSTSAHIWRMSHKLTSSAALYCSEKRIHPTQICAWFGVRETSQCYNEAAMLASMSLLETYKSLEEG